MRVVVVGASGNVGSQVVRALQRDKRVDHIVGLARRVPAADPLGIEWRAADVAADDLVPHFTGADAVVHLAWLIQPSHDERVLHEVNVLGSQRVFDAVAAAEVRALVYGSSIGAYSPGPADPPVAEDWPTDGVPTSVYSRQKAYVERLLDAFEREHQVIRVVRLRPGLVFQRSAAEEIRRYFIGTRLPERLLPSSAHVPVVPSIPGLAVQAVHAQDLGDAYRLAVTESVRGPFNIAADPVLDPDTLAHALGGRKIPVSARLARSVVAASWHLRLQPTDPGWVDLALASPVMDTTRARKVLGWQPEHPSTFGLRELLEGMAEHRGFPTPPLAAAS